MDITVAPGQLVPVFHAAIGASETLENGKTCKKFRLVPEPSLYRDPNAVELHSFDCKGLTCLVLDEPKRELGSWVMIRKVYNTFCTGQWVMPTASQASDFCLTADEIEHRKFDAWMPTHSPVHNGLTLVTAPDCAIPLIGTAKRVSKTERIALLNPRLTATQTYFSAELPNNEYEYGRWKALLLNLFPCLRD